MSQFSRKDQQEQEQNDSNPDEHKLTSTSSSTSTSTSSSSTSSTGETIITPDPTNFDIKHPLQNKWAMWYDAPVQKRLNSNNWKQETKHNKISDFESVEDFWCLFNNLNKPSELADKSTYALMKDGIEPEWESAKDGGCWRLQFSQKENTQEVNQLWLWMVLAVIGESFDDGNDIMGAVLNIRFKGSRLELWLKRSSDSCMRIGTQLKTVLELTSRREIGFLLFADQLNRQDTPTHKI